jgi:hypothetical protein
VLSGYTVDALTGARIPGIGLKGIGDSSDRAYESQYTYTDASGRYILTGLPAGRLWLVTGTDGHYYQTSAVSIDVQANTTQDIGLLKATDLSAASSLPTPPGTRSISGVAYQPTDTGGPTGRPAAGIWIYAQWAYTITDSNGRYFISGLPANQRLTLTGFGTHAPDWESYTNVDPGGDVTIDMQLLTCSPEGCC